MRRAYAPLLVLALAAIAPLEPARAQVRHCVAVDGTLVYTDRRCEDIGATERRIPAGASGVGVRLPRTTCARSIDDLAYALGGAIQSGDVNQVAGVYDWAGMSTSVGYRLMARLQAIALRPLVDVQPMYAGGGNAHGYDVVEFNEETGEVVPAPVRTPRLVGLRVQQTMRNGTTPASTVFGVRQRMGCWWVRL